MEIIDERPNPEIKQLAYLKPGTPFDFRDHICIVTDLRDNGTPNDFKMLAIRIDDGHGLYLDPATTVALVNTETRVTI